MQAAFRIKIGEPVELSPSPHADNIIVDMKNKPSLILDLLAMGEEAPWNNLFTAYRFHK